MKNFKFKLQPVLDYREKIEDILKKELADLRARYEKERDALQFLIKTLKRKQEELKRKQIDHLELDVSELSLYYAYLSKVQQEISLQAIKVRELLSRVDAKRETLVEASKDKRIIEKLYDKHFEEFQQLLLKSEQNLIDEIATSQYKRKRIASLLGEGQGAE